MKRHCNIRSLIFILISCCLIPLALFSCRKKEDSNTITIAEQYGLAYAPLQIMKAKGFLEEMDSSIRVNWVKLANTAAIREAVLAGDVDAGFMGIPPFLIGRDQKMPWKIAAGLSRAPLGLVVPDGTIQTLEDFTGARRIALPQPGSIQHILLTMALDRKYGDPSFLDAQLVSMKHPDGMNSLLSGSVQGHFTSPPYLFQEEDQQGFSLLLSGEEAFGGPFTFIVGAVTEEFRESHPLLYSRYLEALEMAVDYLKESPRESAQILAESYGMEPSLIEEYLSRPGMVYETEVRGVEEFLGFMKRTGMIHHIETADEVFF